MKEGDANSKLFHSLVSNWRNKSIINRLEGENGEVLESSVDIEKELVSFYENPI